MEILGFGFPAGEAGDKSALHAHTGFTWDSAITW